MRIPVFFSVCSLFIYGCASTHTTESERIQQLSQSNQQVFTELDQQLDELEKEVSRIDEDYQRIESSIVSRINIGTPAPSDKSSITTVLNKNNVIIINDNALSKNEFIQFAEKNLPARCAITPKISIETGAAYDTAAFVLETFYAHGCMNVEIIDQ